MTVQSSEFLQVWVMRLSLATTFVVVLLSWSNQVKIFDLIMRAGVSFGVMFLLMAGILSLFEKTSCQNSQDTGLTSNSGRGKLVDFAIGEDESPSPQGQDPRFPGQVDRNLRTGLPNSEQQAEIVRRMGWDDE